MTWLWAVLGLAGAAVGVDRLGLWAESHGWLYWRHRKPGSAGPSGGILVDLIEVFQPQHRHVVEEQDRERLTIRQHGSGAPPFDIDLDAGTALIRLPHEAPPEGG